MPHCSQASAVTAMSVSKLLDSIVFSFYLPDCVLAVLQAFVRVRGVLGVLGQMPGVPRSF